MHLKNPLLFGLMAILLLGGTITPVLSQNAPDSQIVINEVEINPFGSDSGVSGSQEFIEVYNPTSEDIDISGWTFVPTATWKTYEIPNNTFIESQSFSTFTYVNFWFKDFGEIVTLIDDMGNIIDETPLLKDTDNDSKSWQRTSDGSDTNSIVDWELTTFTPNSSNGKLFESQETSFTLAAQVDKNEYQFGDSVIISGNVSEELFNTAISSHSPELVKISIKGPTYFKNIGIFPDRDLNFNTSINLKSVLGFKLGNYDVEISYGDYSVQNEFLIVEEIQESSSESESEILEIFTDKDSYIPGELVVLSANTDSSISFGGLDYTVTNPDGKIIFEGTIFPNETFSTVHQAGGGELYPFSTQLLMSPVNPVYGMYEINATYKSQDYNVTTTNTLEQSATFNLVQDVKEDVSISLSTDKEIYSVGDVIKITGRSNDVWVEDLELRVTQTGILSSGAVGSESRYVAPDPFTLIDSVRLNGDGTFEFEFKLIENFNTQENYAKYFGDYKISVFEYFGHADVFFKIVDNPELFVDNRTPLGLKIDESEYVLGSDISILGKILDYEHYVNDNARNTLEITFVDSNGQAMSFVDHQARHGENTNCNTNDCTKYSTTLIYRALPDIVGTYKLDLVLNPIQFDYGTYTVNVKHPLSGISESLEFEIKSAQSDILEKTEIQEPLTMNICKSNAAYIDNILQALKRIGRGEIAPSMETIDCSENLTFNVGDKLVVTGKVIQKTGINLDQSSTNPSGQTQGGSSYSTNYAQAISNYVEVSIPYPQSMTISTKSSVKTIPNADENYVGGGGSGEGGGYYEDKDGNIIRGEVEGRDSSGSTGYDGRIILQKQKLLLSDMNYKAYPDDEGNFATVFDLRAGVFYDGVYVVKAQYYGYQEQISVKINDGTLKGGLKPSLELNLEKDEFVPGETVRITGSIENVYYFDPVSVKIEIPSVSKLNCLTMDCGFGNNAKKLRVQDTDDGPKFFWNYKLPETASIGSYTIVAHTFFGEYKKQFFVVDESEVIGQVSPQTPESSPTALKIIEKFNRISDNKIQIMLTEKSSDELILEPRVIQGSLFTSARGEESDVNLRISTTDGQCVIGQSSDCLVSESTRKPGAIYSIVMIDDTNYKIRYSGNDVRLEKFSVVPEGSNSKIDIDNWNVEIIKDDQPSRFYYKVSYMALE